MAVLTGRLNELWIAFEQSAARETRADRLAAVETFLAALDKEPLEIWNDWALDLARRIVDDGATIQVPMPLFRRALFPAMLAGHKQKRPGCSRWLAGFAQHLYRCRECQAQLPSEEQSEVGLLRVAVRVDSGDMKSRQQLVRAWSEQLSYSLHELPSGVLYGMDGATAEQCLELQRWIEDFAQLVASMANAADYDQLIRDCRYHFHTYRDYLLPQQEWQSYAAYLDAHPRRDENDRQ